jgi:predicted transcriptional regulator
VIFVLPELNELKIKRKELNLTQIELSEKTGVSQGEIAKIETEKIIPSYLKAKKLIDFLFYPEKEITAKDLMSKKIISINANKTLLNAVELMEFKSVSQLPIMQGIKCIGSINEKNALNALNEVKNKEKILNSKITNFMGKPFPIISEETELKRINSLLKENEAILIINKRNKINGIITKSDLLKKIMRK